MVRLAEEEGLEPPSLAAAVFKTADLPISLFLQNKNPRVIQGFCKWLRQELNQ